MTDSLNTDQNIDLLIRLAKSLKSTLTDEHNALATSNLDNIETYSSTKIKIIEKINTVSKSIGINTPVLTYENPAWKELQETLISCQALNNDNASLNRLKQEEIRQLINIVRQDENSGALYDDTGVIHNPANADYGMT